MNSPYIVMWWCIELSLLLVEEFYINPWENYGKFAG